MKQSVTVTTFRVKRDPEPILLPSSSFSRFSSSSSFPSSEVTVVLPAFVSRRRRSCDECCTPADSDACFCGWCGTLLPRF